MTEHLDAAARLTSGSNVMVCSRSARACGLVSLVALAACTTPSRSREAPREDPDSLVERSAEARRRALSATIDRFGPARPTVARLVGTSTAGALTVERFEYDVADRTVPALLYRPTAPGARRAVVVVLHGTRKAKEDMVPHLELFASRGFLAVSIDARHHGRGVGPRAYEAAMLDAFLRGGHQPYLYDTVWDVLRLLDVLEARLDVDPKRMALVGISKGGTEAYLAAAIDPRVAAVAPLIGVQSFRFALDRELWRPRVATFQWAVDEAARAEGQGVDAVFVRRFFDRIAPGLVEQFDGPDALPLIAPRPLFVVNGELDPRTPLAGVAQAVATASAAYARVGQPHQLETLIQRDTAHVLRPEIFPAVADWLVRVLTPSPDARAAVQGAR